MKLIENISVFDIFKIGIGPSSSHTLGPWKAALQFIDELKLENKLQLVLSINVQLYGSLAKTGIGHGTDIAILMGLTYANPVTIPINDVDIICNEIKKSKKINFASSIIIDFDYDKNFIWLSNETLDFHPNGMRFLVTFSNGENLAYTYYSIGGGFVVKENKSNITEKPSNIILPHPIQKADDLMQWCIKTGMSIHEIVYENELVWRTDFDIKNSIKDIYQVMFDCIYSGCNTSGYLPGGLNVKRRAAALSKKLLKDKTYKNFDEWIELIKIGGHDFNYILDWVSCFALAVNEENASFGRVVTAPTNGASGVIPAVLMYYIIFCKKEIEHSSIQNFLLTASEIGSIFKKGATLSAAMGGCQAEIGVSSSMAAAALTESLGGTQKQVLMAGEIAMEHHLGLTCDPVGGLVQVPCIERNTMGAIKAIMASQLALNSTPDFAKVSLDHVVNTMWQTALDMNHKYKETADGGLALQISVGLSEC